MLLLGFTDGLQWLTAIVTTRLSQGLLQVRLTIGRNE